MSAPPNVEHPKLRQLWEYWDGKRGARAMPASADLDPLEMRFVIGNIVLVDVIHGTPLDFRVRLHGTNLSEQVGFELTGKSIDAIPLREFRELTRQTFVKLVTSKQPFHAKRDLILDHRRRVYETVMLPLSNDGERVEMILVGLFYSHLEH